MGMVVGPDAEHQSGGLLGSGERKKHRLQIKVVGEKKKISRKLEEFLTSHSKLKLVGQELSWHCWERLGHPGGRGKK